MRLRNVTLCLVCALPAACLYDGEGTEGLPCNADADCGAHACVDQVCGGPAGAPLGEGSSGGGSSEGGSGGSDEGPTPQQLPQPCASGHQACIGSNAMEVCDEDGKLRSFECEAWCGMDNPPQGGCQADPRNGVESCWCESQGGPPSGTCGDTCSSDFDCAAGERCWSLTSGSECAPSACGGCFDSGIGCTWLTDSCQFEGCG